MKKLLSSLYVRLVIVKERFRSILQWTENTVDPVYVDTERTTQKCPV